MQTPLLRDCNACGKEISRHSAFCRHCGHPQKLPLAIWLMVLFLIMMVAVYVAFTIYAAMHLSDFCVVEEACALSAKGFDAYAMPAVRAGQVACNDSQVPAVRLMT